MKRISYSSLAFLAAMTLASVAGATPNPNGVQFKLHYLPPWDTLVQCPVSIPTTENNYPFSIAIQDSFMPCASWMNQSLWHFSEDGGATAARLHSADNFKFSTELVVDGTTAAGGEAYININPWWVEFDGRINVKAGMGGGEIAAFGGFMPFVTWTNAADPSNIWASSLSYVKGTVITLGIEYIGGPTGPSIAFPGRVKYYLNYGGTDYNTGYFPLSVGDTDQFDSVHNAPDCYVYAGGGIGVIGDSPNFDTKMKATWSNIQFTNLQSTPTKSSTWGAMKALYR